MNVSDLKTLDDCRKANQAARDEHERILEESTERRLARNADLQRAITFRMMEIEREQSNIRHSSVAKKTQLEQDLEAALVENQKLERAIVTECCNGLALAGRYIRTDAVEHFSEPSRLARERADKAAAENTSGTMKPAGRILAMGREADELEAQWRRERKYAEAGEQVYAIRQKRAAVEAELAEMRQEREEAALKAAGVLV